MYLDRFRLTDRVALVTCFGPERPLLLAEPDLCDCAAPKARV